MRVALIDSLDRRFRSYADLIEQLEDAALVEVLDIPKHKSLKDHLWCIVGARESYAVSLRAGRWVGFACSMTECSQASFRQKLASSSQAVRDAIAAVGSWSGEHDDLLIDLAEHEVMHEGQIIRHLYGVGRAIPSSCKWA